MNQPLVSQHWTLLVLTCLFLPLTFALSFAQDGPTLVIRGGQIFEAESAETRPLGQLWIQGERILGERPAGMLPTTHPLLLAASAATEAVGHEPEPSVSSTDANVPLALGIPAIAIGGGGRSGNAHTMHEWFEDTDGAAGALRALSLLAAIARF